MKIERCKNGHFFDAEKFSNCPHCKWNDNNEIDDAKDKLPERFKQLGTITRIGQGSVGVVYRISGANQYVVKTIVCDDNAHKLANALKEIKIMQALKGVSSAVQVLDTEIDSNNTVFILEECLENFSKYLSRQPVSLLDIVKILSKVCEAAIECRDANVAHLDIQPKNIFFREQDSRIVLGDFSSSLFLDELKSNKNMRGTLAYMAPEVYREGICSEKSDIYSIGLLLYCLLNEKKLPFTDQDEYKVAIYKRLAGTPLPELEKDDLPQEINRIICTACAFEACNRFQRFEELQSALDVILNGLCEGKINNPVVFHDNLFLRRSTIYNKISKIYDADEVAKSTLLIPGKNHTHKPDGLSGLSGWADTEITYQGNNMFNADSMATTVALNENSDTINVQSEKPAGKYRQCRACGTVFHRKLHFCPSCGTEVLVEKAKHYPTYDAKALVEQRKLDISKVHFSAVAPKTFIKGEYTIINIVMYEESFRKIVNEIISNSEVPVKETRSGTINVSDNSIIKIQLYSPDILIEDNEEEQIWQREYLNFSFAIMLPENYTKRQILFTATVYINDVIATRLKFIAKSSSLREQKIEVFKEDVLSAFVSYASQDRQRVAMIIQGMKKVRPDMDIFFDVDSLRSGEAWERALWSEIEKRDTLFLCWSQYAKKSKWVDAEWRYAYKHKGVECIEPIPLESPANCPPPKELRDKHFNDKLLYIIQASPFRG